VDTGINQQWETHILPPAQKANMRPTNASSSTRFSRERAVKAWSRLRQKIGEHGGSKTLEADIETNTGFRSGVTVSAPLAGPGFELSNITQRGGAEAPPSSVTGRSISIGSMGGLSRKGKPIPPLSKSDQQDQPDA